MSLELIDKEGIKQSRKLKRLRIFHRKDYEFLTWTKCVTSAYIRIDKTRELMNITNVSRAWADCTLQSFGEMTAAVRLWRKHKLFHPSNADRVDYLMNEMLPNVEESIQAMLEYSDTMIYKDLWDLMRKMKSDIMEETSELLQVCVDDDEDVESHETDAGYVSIIKTSLRQKMVAHRCRVMLSTNLTNLRNAIIEDVLELAMCLDVVDDRKYSRIISKAMRHGKYKYVDIKPDKQKWLKPIDNDEED